MHRTAPDRRFIVAGLSGILLVPASAQTNAAAGRVIAVSGEAMALLDKLNRALAANSDVFVGDRITTGEGARAAIRLGDATDLRLGARARITIDRFLLNAGGTISLGAGAMMLDKPPNGPEMQIRSAYGAIAVRGTQVFAGPSKGVFGVFVQRGNVRVSAAGRSVILNAGEGTDIARPGAPPSRATAWGEARIAAALAAVR